MKPSDEAMACAQAWLARRVIEDTVAQHRSLAEAFDAHVAEARRAALEEAAVWCEIRAGRGGYTGYYGGEHNDTHRRALDDVADDIRALAEPKGEK